MSITFDQMQVLTKTDLGRRTIVDRSIELPRATRTILLLVDGRSTVEKLQKFIAATRAGEKTLEELEAKGLIARVSGPAASAAPAATAATPAAVRAEPVAEAPVAMPASEVERFNALYELMCEVSATFLGLRGYFVQLKIERSANAAELLALKHDLVEAIAGRHGPDVAREISHRIKELA